MVSNREQSGKKSHGKQAGKNQNTTQKWLLRALLRAPDLLPYNLNAYLRLFLMNSVMLKLPREKKIRNLKKYNFLPLFYCSATLMSLLLLVAETKIYYSLIYPFNTTLTN